MFQEKNSARKLNFGVGPTMLPLEVLDIINEDLYNYHGTGASILEHSHRGKLVSDLIDETIAKFIKLLNIPKNYKVIFAAGGGQAHFALTALNLTATIQDTADYLLTGYWAEQAFLTAKNFCSPNLFKTYEEYKNQEPLNSNSKYFYYCNNETLDGTAINFIPQAKSPLVVDMTSSLLVKDCGNIDQYGLIFGGLQKNMGISGLVVVIIEEQLLQNKKHNLPHIWNYNSLYKEHSVVNSMPVFSLYVCNLVLAWLMKHGTMDHFYQLNTIKATKFYSYLDSRKDFFINTIPSDLRSTVNIVFSLKTSELTEKFMIEADQEANIIGIEGNKKVGGFRISLYNVTTIADVDLLIKFMEYFYLKYNK